jgi:hypothetical protein
VFGPKAIDFTGIEPLLHLRGMEGVLAKLTEGAQYPL